MARALFPNNCVTALAQDVAVGAINLPVRAGEGAKFGTIPTGDWIETRLGLPALNEVVAVTGRTGDTLVCEPTTRAWSAGTAVKVTACQELMAEFLQAEDIGDLGAGDMVGANNLSELTDTAAARTNLELGAAATKDVGTGSGDVAAGDAPAAAEAAAKAYADGLVVGLIDGRGNWDASGNTYPDGTPHPSNGDKGGSGPSNAIREGDLWFLSHEGTLGGVSLAVGTSVRALVDSPGQTSTNWAIIAIPVGFVPENTTNKSTSVPTDQASNTKYPSVKSVYDWAVAAFQPLSSLLTAIAALSGSGWLKFTGGTPSVSAIATGDLPANVITYDFGFCYPGKPAASQNFGCYTVVTPCALPATLTGSYGAVDVANPAASYVLTIKKNGSSIGTATISTGGAVSFSFASQVSLAAGDRLSMFGQASADSTLDTPAVTLKATVA